MSLIATDACLDCGKPVHVTCHAGDTLRLECETSPTGGFAYAAGVFHRVMKRGEPASIYTIDESLTYGLMRYADHKTTCTHSLRPEPPSEMKATKPERPTRIRR